MKTLLLAALVLSLGTAQAGQCSARSSDKTVALVELYTSEGCDSCPPADRWLSSLGPRQAHSARQRKMAKLARAAMVYTPQVMLQGQDFRRWGSPDFDLAVSKINALPAKARISLSLNPKRRDAFEVEAAAELLGAPSPDLALFLGAYENKLVSEVKAGENRGKSLPHDYVVLQWAGPLEFKGAKLSERHVLPLLPKAVPGHSGVVAFVQNRATGEVLQALMLPACPS